MKPRSNTSKKIIRLVLYPLLWFLSIVYAICVEIKYFLYNSGLLQKRKLPQQVRTKVLCVGNITSGGTGKTTVVAYLANKISAEGHKVAILSRGYRRQRSNDTVIVSTGKDILSPVEIAGDEPYMLAQNLPDVAVIVSKNRYEAGKVAIEKFNSEVMILDDGFQHWALYRDIDIVVIDCLNPFGNNALLPLGLLRERLSGLNRAKLIILNNAKFVPQEVVNAIVTRIQQYNSTAELIKVTPEPSILKNILSNKELPVEWLTGKEVTALASIGNPVAFILTLQSLGAIIKKNITYPDHHWYTQIEVAEIAKNELVVTTAKDTVRLYKLVQKNLYNNFFTLEICINNKSELWKKILAFF